MNNEIQRFDFKGASLPGDGRGTEDNIILETQHGSPTSTLPADIIEGTCNVSRTVRKTFLSLTMYIDGLSRLNVHDPNAKLTANELDRLADLFHEQAVHARQLATGNQEQ